MVKAIHRTEDAAAYGIFMVEVAAASHRIAATTNRISGNRGAKGPDLCPSRKVLCINRCCCSTKSVTSNVVDPLNVMTCECSVDLILDAIDVLIETPVVIALSTGERTHDVQEPVSNV